MCLTGFDHFALLHFNPVSPMSLTPAQMDRKIDEHFAYEGSDDVAGVLATLAPDVTHDVIGYPTGPSHGHAAARQF